MVSAVGDSLSVVIARHDWIDWDVITVGGVVVFVEADDKRLDPTKARAFAALLVEAADLAEQGSPDP